MGKLATYERMMEPGFAVGVPGPTSLSVNYDSESESWVGQWLGVFSAGSTREEAIVATISAVIMHSRAKLEAAEKSLQAVRDVFKSYNRYELTLDVISESALVDGALQELTEADVSRHRLIRRIDEVEAERDALREKYEALTEAVAVAYQFCAARGANITLLDNLSALASSKPAPHGEWPIETGAWEWKCGHHAETACAQCGEELREKCEALEADRTRLDWLHRKGWKGLHATRLRGHEGEARTMTTSEKAMIVLILVIGAVAAVVLFWGTKP
jgi:hypothetical protein